MFHVGSICKLINGLMLHCVCSVLSCTVPGALKLLQNGDLGESSSINLNLYYYPKAYEDHNQTKYMNVENIVKNKSSTRNIIRI